MAKDIDLRQAIYVTEHRSEFPEVSVSRDRRAAATRTTTRRADILGYLGQVNEDELESHTGEGYQARDTIGKTGIEQLFESELRGKPGKDKVEVDNQGRVPSTRSTVTRPEAGHDVRLTVDLPDAADRRGVADPGHGGRSHAWSIPTAATTTRPTPARWWCSTPRTGAVVAMASNPSFNPNDFIAGNADQYFEDPEQRRCSTAR